MGSTTQIISLGKLFRDAATSVVTSN